MPLLQVRDCPIDVYNAINAMARQMNRTIDEEAIIVLMDGLKRREANKERRRRVLAEIAARNVPEAAQKIGVCALIHEDHQR
ncbi:MAG: hypothetical protein MdMp014T_2932 [Treponematales bacterium]